MVQQASRPAGEGSHQHPDKAALFGQLGDVRPVGGGVSEIRIDYGPGYRVYFMQRGAGLVVLPAGGDKKSQRRDIARARKLALEL